VEPGGAPFATRVLLSLGRTAFAFLRLPLVLLCNRRVFRLALLGHPLALLCRPLMLLCDRPEFRRLFPLGSGTILTHPRLLRCCRREFGGPFALAPGVGLLIARPAGVRLGLLTMSGCLDAKALSLPVAVLRRPAGREQRQRKHYQDAEDDEDHGDGGHDLVLPIAVFPKPATAPRAAAVTRTAPLPGRAPGGPGLI
jgi:hypothetical protein